MVETVLPVTYTTNVFNQSRYVPLVVIVAHNASVDSDAFPGFDDVSVKRFRYRPLICPAQYGETLRHHSGQVVCGSELSITLVQELLDRFVPTNGVVLDVGGGAGTVSRCCAARGTSSVLVEISRERVDACFSRLERLKADIGLNNIGDLMMARAMQEYYFRAEKWAPVGPNPSIKIPPKEGVMRLKHVEKPSSSSSSGSNDASATS
jgi:hypothetical protein